MYTWDELVALCPLEIQGILRYLDVGAATAQQLVVQYHDKAPNDSTWRWRLADILDALIDQHPPDLRDRLQARTRYLNRDANLIDYAQRIAQALSEGQGRDAYDRAMQEIARRWLLSTI